MDKWLAETCWADSKINKIVIIASSWSYIIHQQFQMYDITTQMYDITTQMYDITTQMYDITTQMYDITTQMLPLIFCD